MSETLRWILFGAFVVLWARSEWCWYKIRQRKRQIRHPIPAAESPQYQPTPIPRSDR